MKDNGIISQLTPPYTLQMNGVLKRRNHTLVDMISSMMSFSILLVFLWGYALIELSINETCYIVNLWPLLYMRYEKERNPTLKYKDVWPM